MTHSFSVEIAAKLGLNAAILLDNLGFWIAKNEANNVNFRDGNYWTFNSMKAFATLFPYMTKRQIEFALKKLKDEGLIVTANYNEQKYDRTLWYALTEKGKSISHGCEMEVTPVLNGNHTHVTPIPDSKPDINTDIDTTPYPLEGEDCPIAEENEKTETPEEAKETETEEPITEQLKRVFSEDIAEHKSDKPKAKSFTAPTVDEVKTYCAERKNSVDAETFVDFYSAKGWKIGKNPMVDWKAAVRTWERNRDGPNKRQAYHNSDSGRIDEDAALLPF